MVLVLYEHSRTGSSDFARSLTFPGNVHNSANTEKSWVRVCVCREISGLVLNNIQIWHNLILGPLWGFLFLSFFFFPEMCLINVLKAGSKFRTLLPTNTCVWAQAILDRQICTQINVLYSNILKELAGVLLHLISVFTARNKAAVRVRVLNIIFNAFRKMCFSY